MGPLSQVSLQADEAFADASSPKDKHLYADKYDLSTNAWGVGDAGPDWYEYISIPSTSSMDGAVYKWTGFTLGRGNSVKSYPSIRTGFTNKRNDPATSGLPYQLGKNTTNIDVVWNFTATGYDGSGEVQGSHNHALDLFFCKTGNFRLVNRAAELMVIVSSSADSETEGWGTKDSTVYRDAEGNIWDVWQATMSVREYSWPVMQFRRRINATSLKHNLKDFLAEAIKRRPDVFQSTHYVMMVEAGTEVKSGSGMVRTDTFSVNVH